MSWCITRNMSWDAVEEICRVHDITFDELPIFDGDFWTELKKVSRAPKLDIVT